MTQENKFSTLLQEIAKEDYKNAVNHLFVQKMVNGELDRVSFKNYLLQDYAFVNTFVDLVSYTLAYSQTMNQKHCLSNFLSMITSDEDGYFIRSFKELEVSQEEYLNIATSPVMEEFIVLIKKAIESGKEDRERGYRNCLAVLMCAESVYCDWGVKYIDKHPKEYYFDEWIRLHSNKEFVEFVNWLKNEVDKLLPLTDIAKDEVKNFFKEACKLEYSFFEESLYKK